MGLKPTRAAWFEVLTRREELAGVVASLARTGAVQVEPSATADEAELRDLMAGLEDFDRLARRYAPYWPSELSATTTPGPPLGVVIDALEQVQGWASAADPVIDELERLVDEAADLTLLAELLQAGGQGLPDLVKLAGAGSLLRVEVVAVDRDDALPEPRDDALSLSVDGPVHRFALMVTPTSAPGEAASSDDATKARRLSLPRWLASAGSAGLAQIKARSAAVERAIESTRSRLVALSSAHELSVAVSDLAHLRWFFAAVPPVTRTRSLVRVQGWTSDESGELLDRATSGGGGRALVELGACPPDREAPVVFRNRAWVRPFEAFARLIGTPGSEDVDPSVMVSVIVPLLFGFMFGDVGQGLVLLVAGLILRRRWPALGLLVPAGFSATVFGLLFGAVFMREGVIEALWLRPLEEPVVLLGVAVAGGAVILLLGLSLAGLGSFWQGTARRWWRTEAPLIVAYVGLLGALVHPAALWGLALGLTWTGLGHVAARPSGRLGALAAALGEFAERLLQLGVNTLSFARVGAFALAHAGLSAALMALTGAAGHPVTVVTIMVVGNLFVVVLEGLVVSIQTTRLVLFEFFVRFFRAQGRRFRPLAPPPAVGVTVGSRGA